MRNSDVKYIDNKYPLVEQKLEREKLKEIIISMGYELPIKSGCYFCPFTTKKGWIHLRNNHKELWSKSLALEKNSNMRLPLITLKRKKYSKLFLNVNVLMAKKKSRKPKKKS